jgi:transcriptional regulator GlxA family with amidase domain
MAIDGSNMQRIAHVIHILKTKFSEPVRVEDLAEVAHMSPSSFHFHFKEATAMSPLQYQKRLRLLEARRLLLVEGADAASAAYRVGYESASQYSREYSRMFGAPLSVMLPIFERAKGLTR